MSQITHKLVSPPTTPRKSFWTISRKLLTPSVALMSIVSLGLIIYIAAFTIRRNQAEATRDLTRTLTAVQSSLEDLESLSLGLATEMAANPQVQAAFAARDRELLSEITLPTFEVVNREFDVKQYQFILPPATSFLRLHQLDNFGDDLSSFRFTVLAANETQKPVSGIEIGRGGLGIRGEVPVFYQGRHIGVVDVGLDIGPAFLENIKRQYGIDAQIMLEATAAQTAIFEGATSELSGPIPELLIQASTFPQPFYAEPAVYERILKGETLVSRLNYNERTYSVISAPVKDYSGKVIGVLEIFSDRTDIIASQSLGLILSIAIGLIATVMGALILVNIINRTVQPISALTETATALAGGDLDRQVKIQSQDELGILATAFNNMTGRLRELIGSLETRVADRTRNLELAAEVGHSISQVRDLESMLRDAAEIIRSRFDLYYTQVYLVNQARNSLTLQAGTGTVGAELVGRGHSLPINTNSINGRAVVEKQPVIISDTAASASFRPNPLLPETRSEMAVPLMVGEKVVGVLDLQSNQSGFLDKEILPAFEALAGQLAVAIQNANLLAEAEQARAEVEKQAKRLARSNWQGYLDAIHKPEALGYKFEHNQILPLEEAHETPNGDSALTALIAIAGESLGSLSVEFESAEQNPRNTELISSVARQVAQQIESLRLLESAERYRLEAEEASRRLTREGWKEYVTGQADQSPGYIYDLREVRPYRQHEDTLTEDSALSLPLKVRDEAIGRLVVQGIGSKETESLELANAVAERLSAHIESLRQFDQTQSALAQSEKLFEASRRLTQATDLQELVKVSVEMLNVPSINRASLGVFSYNAAGELETMTDIANFWNGIGAEPPAVGTSYSAQSLKVLSIFLSNTPIFFNDTFHDERMGEAELQILKRLNVQALAVLPLILSQRQIGVLRLLAEEPHTFTAEETRLFSSLAPQIATVLENRRQFEQAQKQAERESMLNVISQKIQGATSVEAVLQIAARELGHALGAPLTIAQLGVKDGK